MTSTAFTTTLLLLFITTTAATDTPAPFPTPTPTPILSPSPSPIPPLSLLSPPQPHQQPPQSPPPPPPPPQQTQFNTIIDAIIGAGDFSNWANFLSQSDPSIFPLSATFLIPDDTSSAASTTVDPLLFTYHIIPRRFTFSELCLFPIGARLPTLLPGNTLLITNNSAVNFTVNAATITHPDLFRSAVFTVHGVSGVLDYTHFGEDHSSSLPPANSPSFPSMASDPSNPSPVSIQFEGNGNSNPNSTNQFLIKGNAKNPANSISRTFWEFCFGCMVILVTLNFLGFLGLNHQIVRM